MVDSSRIHCLAILSWSENVPATAVTFEELIKFILAHPIDKLCQEWAVFDMFVGADF